MKAKKLLLILIAILLITSLTLTLVACKDDQGDTPDDGGSNSVVEGDPQEGEDLGGDNTGADANVDMIPVNVKVDSQVKVTWTSVKNSDGYQVEVNGTLHSKNLSFNNFDLLSFATLPKNGKFVIRVRSLFDADKYSQWSDKYVYTYNGGSLILPTIVNVENNVMTWTEDAFKTYQGIDVPYPVVVIDGEENKLATDALSYTFNVSKKVNVSLYYKGDEVYNKTSAALKLVYDPDVAKDSDRLSFAPPTNVRMEGEVLLFDKVEGADTYYFTDVYSTTTILTTGKMDGFSNDRKGHYLIKEMYVSSSAGIVKRSAPAQVVYFTEENGAGTKEDPFKISSASDMRYIEYYEAINESKYYELVNDIRFDTSYVPKDDEEYSNFYDLGSFSGELDGKGHTLYDIVIHYKDGFSAIFNTISKNAKICNINIENCKFRTWTNRTNDGIMHNKGGDVAIFARENKGLIENITLSSGFVIAKRDGAAGIVIENDKTGIVRNCQVKSGFEVYGANEAGAFVVYNEGEIVDCVNYGKVSGNYAIGGIVGRNAGNVSRCGNNGVVTGDINVGGITGYNYNVANSGRTQYQPLIEECYNKGAIVGTVYSGGIAGRNGSSGVNELGVDSYANAGIYGCYNQGTVSGMIAAGITAQNFAWLDEANKFGVNACYSSGDINYTVPGYEENKIYLSVSACSWAETGSPAIYCHAWKNQGGDVQAAAPWPGIQMEKVTVGTSNYYVANMPNGWKVSELSGLIFSRVDSKNSFNVYNSTSDITAIPSYSSGVYYIDGNWSGASLVGQGVAAIAAENNAINNCYCVSADVYYNGEKIEDLVLTRGGNSISSAIKTREDLKNIYTTLNDVLGKDVFVKSSTNGITTYPELAWEKQ